MFSYTDRVRNHKVRTYVVTSGVEELKEYYLLEVTQLSVDSKLCHLPIDFRTQRVTKNRTFNV